LFKLIGEVLFDEREERIARRLLRGIGAARSDLQDCVEKCCVGASVCNAVVFAPQRADANAPKRKDTLFVIALFGEALSEGIAEAADTFCVSKIRAVLEC
jgi:hypothetical protein